MSKYNSPQDFKDAIAKQLGIAPEKIALFDNFGNERDKVTPVFSPTLVFLLCAVHNQNVIHVRNVDGEPFATFNASKVVDDAIKLWYAITDHYENGSHMPINELIDIYLREQVNKKNRRKIDQLGESRKTFVTEHSKSCKDCSHAQAT